MGARRCTLEAGFNSLLAPVASESGDDLREIDSENHNCCNLSCGDKRMRLSSSGLGRLQEEGELFLVCSAQRFIPTQTASHRFSNLQLSITVFEFPSVQLLLLLVLPNP